MTTLIVAIAFTLGVSAFCSLLEAFILSTTTAEVENLKVSYPKRGQLLEKFKNDIEETTSALLTLNTLAHTLGAALVGIYAAKLFDKFWVGVISGGLVFAILIFSEVIPKNMGIIYRKHLSNLVYPLHFVRIVMIPLSFLCKLSVRLIVRKKPSMSTAEQEREIILLAEKSAKEGSLSRNERDMIHNALSLDDILISDIMTPRTVVTAMDQNLTIEDVFSDYRNIPFARIPVYDETIDNIVGVVRRRDLLQARADDRDSVTVAELKGEIIFVADTANAADALQLFLKNHQQLGVVVDEFGSTAGVVAMEDIVEHILGREIYEETDIAVDMRALARSKAQSNEHNTSEEKTRLSRSPNPATVRRPAS